MGIISLLILLFALNANNGMAAERNNPQEVTSGIRKIKNVMIYEDSAFYSSFPSVVKRADGQILVAFRRAPNRQLLGESHTNHVDPNSYLMMVRSVDGENWTNEPDQFYAHPFGGSQDPCLLQLQDGTLICASYGWALTRPEALPNLKKPYVTSGEMTFLGGYLIRSTDGGENWTAPIYPPHVPSEINYNALGNRLPAYNRGALCEGKNGRIFWAVAASDTEALAKTSVHLLVSDDKGLTWKYTTPIAQDSKVSFNETSVYETPKGDLVAFIRSENAGRQACVARSKDGGKTFQPWESMGFSGFPLTAMRLPDNRVLLTYGYRQAPFGIRARILNAECTDFKTAPEIILRDDGGNGDLGYPWSVQVDKNTVLVVYYFNKANGTRYIAGTLMEIKP